MKYTNQCNKPSKYILNQLSKIYGIEKNNNEGFMVKDENGNVRKAEISDVKNLFEEE